jgi:hypothetical protein
MKNDNTVTLVFVPTSLSAQGEAVSDVATAGELGVFDFNTNLVIDADPGAPLAKELYLVMHTVNNGILRTPKISLSKVNSISKKAPVTAVAAKCTITIGTVTEGDYVGVKIAIESGDSYQHLGVNQVWKPFYIAAKSTAALTATALAAAINADEESVAKGGFMEATASSNVVTVTFTYGNDDQSIVSLGKTILAVPNDPALVIDNNIAGTLTPKFAFAQGKGAFVQALERANAGYMGKGTGIAEYRYIKEIPYPLYKGFVPDAVETSTYTMYTINFDIDYPENVGYLNNYEIILATPTAGVVTALDAFFAAISIKGQLIGFS